MSVSGIDDDSIYTGLHQSLHALEGVGCDAHAGSHAQATLLVLAGHWLVGCLGYILICYKSEQTVLAIHHGQLLNLVLQEYL